MADWVPIYRKVFTDPRMATLAAQLGIARDPAIMHCIHLWHAVADQSPAKGQISEVDDATLEVWAEWRGKRGRFAGAYRTLFEVAGCIRNWEKYVGDALEAAEREKERKRIWWREHRGKNGKLDTDSPSSVGASKKSNKRASGGVQDKTDMTNTPKPPTALAAAASPNGPPRAGPRGPETLASIPSLRDIAAEVGLEPPETPVPVTPEKAAEVEANRQRWLASLRNGSPQTVTPPEAPHGHLAP